MSCSHPAPHDRGDVYDLDTALRRARLLNQSGLLAVDDAVALYCDERRAWHVVSFAYAQWLTKRNVAWTDELDEPDPPKRRPWLDVACALVIAAVVAAIVWQLLA